MWTPKSIARRLLGFALIAASLLLGGCMATSVLTFAYERTHEGQCVSAGCAAGAVLGYAIDKATEGDPTPCYKLNTVERALSPRCGAYEPGSLLTKDVTASGLPRCPLTLAARDPQLWPVLPELMAKGASLARCNESPLAALAQANACPDFSSASVESMAALRSLADNDPRAIHHDVMRMLSCPKAVATGLETVIYQWLAKGQLPPQGLAFGPLGALDPTDLDSPLSRSLEARGHTAQAALGAYAGRLPSGFDFALRTGNTAALDWWFQRLPDLANRVPAREGNQFAWLPLARVITPNYLERPDQQMQMVNYLLSRGADPWRALPHDTSQSVVSYARQIKSPSLPLLDQPLRAANTQLGAATVSSTAGIGAAAPQTLP